MPVSISRITLPAPVTSHDELATPHDGDGPLGRDLHDERVRERAVDGHAGDRRQRAQRSLDLVRVDRDEASAHEVPRGRLDLAR